ncbi:hypothetical protein STEG23_000015, partial [Scotinomys teguina]
ASLCGIDTSVQSYCCFFVVVPDATLSILTSGFHFEPSQCAEVLTSPCPAADVKGHGVLSASSDSGRSFKMSNKNFELGRGREAERQKHNFPENNNNERAEERESSVAENAENRYSRRWCAENRYSQRWCAENRYSRRWCAENRYSRRWCAENRYSRRWCAENRYSRR